MYVTFTEHLKEQEIKQHHLHGCKIHFYTPNDQRVFMTPSNLQLFFLFIFLILLTNKSNPPASTDHYLVIFITWSLHLLIRNENCQTGGTHINVMWITSVFIASSIVADRFLPHAAAVKVIYVLVWGQHSSVMVSIVTSQQQGALCVEIQRFSQACVGFLWVLWLRLKVLSMFVRLIRCFIS